MQPCSITGRGSFRDSSYNHTHTHTHTHICVLSSLTYLLTQEPSKGHRLLVLKGTGSWGPISLGKSLLRGSCLPNSTLKSTEFTCAWNMQNLMSRVSLATGRASWRRQHTADLSLPICSGWLRLLGKNTILHLIYYYSSITYWVFTIGQSLF